MIAPTIMIDPLQNPIENADVNIHDVEQLRLQIEKECNDEASLRRMYSAQKKELKALENVRVLKLDKEAIQLKKEIAEGKHTHKSQTTIN